MKSQRQQYDFTPGKLRKGRVIKQKYRKLKCCFLFFKPSLKCAHS